MKEYTKERLRTFEKNEKAAVEPFKEFPEFDFVRDFCCSGSAQVGNGGYLILWHAKELENLNRMYCVKTFLTNSFLIGSDGGDMAYGVNSHGEFILVPFIGMNDHAVRIIARSFDEFIEYVANLSQ